METKSQRSVYHGSSLRVENVQALSSKNLKEIPPRYLRPEAELDPVAAEDSVHIPVIDMCKLHDDQHPFIQLGEMERLHSACTEWGFFQLINHGVPEDVLEKMKITVEEFFQMPLEKKKANSQMPNGVEGYGQVFVFSEDQKLDWGDMLYLVAQPNFLRNTALWPTQPDSFADSLDKYSWESRKLTLSLLKLMSRNLGLKSETLASTFENGRQGVKMNFYPPCAQAEKVIGHSPHFDINGLTLILQVNDVQGLQFKKNGKWVPVKPVSAGAFIVNIGDAIEMMSNGEYKSTAHRVVVNPEKHRLSIAVFEGPHAEAIIGPLPDLVIENKAKFKAISCGDYIARLRQFGNFDGNRIIDHLKIEE